MNDKQQAEGAQGAEVGLGLDIMLEATEQGLNRRETASMTGATIRRVELAEKRYCSQGVLLKKEKRGPKTDTADKVKLLLEQGELTVQEIAKQLGVTPQRIYKIRKQGGK